MQRAAQASYGKLTDSENSKWRTTTSEKGCIIYQALVDYAWNIAYCSIPLFTQNELVILFKSHTIPRVCIPQVQNGPQIVKLKLSLHAQR